MIAAQGIIELISVKSSQKKKRHLHFDTINIFNFHPQNGQIKQIVAKPKLSGLQ